MDATLSTAPTLVLLRRACGGRGQKGKQYLLVVALVHPCTYSFLPLLLAFLFFSLLFSSFSSLLFSSLFVFCCCDGRWSNRRVTQRRSATLFCGLDALLGKVRCAGTHAHTHTRALVFLLVLYAVCCALLGCVGWSVVSYCTVCCAVLYGEEREDGKYVCVVCVCVCVAHAFARAHVTCAPAAAEGTHFLHCADACSSLVSSKKRSSSSLRLREVRMAVRWRCRDGRWSDCLQALNCTHTHARTRTHTHIHARATSTCSGAPWAGAKPL